jgi:hypothetical protein
VGYCDVFDASSFSVRLLAVFFLLAGITVLTAAAGLIFGTQWGAFLGLIASLLGIIIGFVMSAIQLIGREDNFALGSWRLDYRLGIWVALAVVAALCTRLLLANGVDAAPLKRLPTLLSAIGILGLFQFWYGQLYLPTTPEPNLTVSINLTKEGASIIDKAGTQMLAVTATMSIKNAGPKARLVASSFEAIAYEAELRSKGVEDNDFMLALRNDGQSLRFGTYQKSKVIASQMLLYGGNWLESGQELSPQFIFYVPRTFDRVAVVAELHVGNGVRFDYSSECHTERTKLDDNTWAWSIKESSTINDWTRDSRCIHVGLVRERSQEFHPHLVQYIERVDRLSPKDYEGAMRRLYGLVTITAVSELSVWETNADAGATEPTKMVGKNRKGEEVLSNTR